jgi:hypothetical protein
MSGWTGWLFFDVFCPLIGALSLITVLVIVVTGRG